MDLRLLAKTWTCLPLWATLTLVAGFLAPAWAQAPRLALESVPAGPHPVAFQRIDLFDRSRTFGVVSEPEAPSSSQWARPIQLLIWSPARPNRETSMRFADYTHLYPTARIHANRNAEEKAAMEREYAEFLAKVSNIAPEQVLQSEMLAARDAPPASGPFPLVVYSSGNMGEPAENAVLFELLASHGFVVAAIPLVGPDERNTTLDRRGIEAAVRDLAFVTGFLSDFKGVDFDRVGVMGHSWGGLAALLLKTRNAQIDAALILDGSIPFLERDLLPEFDPGSVRGPVLMTATTDSYPSHRAFFGRLKYAQAGLIRFSGLQHQEFTSYPWLVRRAEAARGKPDHAAARQGYELLANCALHFFKAHLYGDEDAAAWLDRTAAPDWGDGLATARLKDALPAPPTQAEFFEMIREEGMAKARTVYAEVLARDPGFRLFAEADMNLLGFELFNDLNRPEDAVDAMKLNVAAYPRSHDAMYFLGRIYEKKGDRDLALLHYAKAHGMALAADVASPDLEEFKARCQRVIDRVLADK